MFIHIKIYKPVSHVYTRRKTHTYKGAILIVILILLNLYCITIWGGYD